MVNLYLYIYLKSRIKRNINLQYYTSRIGTYFKENVICYSILRTNIQSKANSYLLLSCLPTGQVL